MVPTLDRQKLTGTFSHTPVALSCLTIRYDLSLMPVGDIRCELAGRGGSPGFPNFHSESSGKVSVLKWLWLLRASKIRIPVALLGFWILFAGWRNLTHPALIMVEPKAAPAATGSDASFQSVVMTPS